MESDTSLRTQASQAFPHVTLSGVEGWRGQGLVVEQVLTSASTPLGLT